LEKRVKVKLVDVRKDPRTGKTRFALSIKAALDAPDPGSEVAAAEQNS